MQSSTLERTHKRQLPGQCDGGRMISCDAIERAEEETGVFDPWPQMKADVLGCNDAAGHVEATEFVSD